MTTTKCKFHGCCDGSLSKGYCQKHYNKVISAYWRRYRLTPEAVSEQLKKQDNKCALFCLGRCSGGPPRDIDHDHQTGQLRGMLCHRHNMLLGYLEGEKGLCDMKALSEAVIKYTSGQLIDFLQPDVSDEYTCAYSKCGSVFSGKRKGTRYCSKKCCLKAKNVRSQRAKLGRDPKPHQKLDRRAVEHIRACDESSSVLAKFYNVSVSTISAARRGERTWFDEAGCPNKADEYRLAVEELTA